MEATGEHVGQHGYNHRKDDYLKRLRRIEGQARGLQKMVEDEKYCTANLDHRKTRSVGVPAPGEAAADGTAGPDPPGGDPGVLPFGDDHVRQLILDAVRNAEHAGAAIPAHHPSTPAPPAPTPHWRCPPRQPPTPPNLNGAL